MTRLVPDPLLERVTRDPDAPALRARSATWTRAELLAAADDLAAALATVGAGEGGRVACLLDDDALAVALIHGLRRVGAVHVPLNRRLAAPELRAQLELVAAKWLLTDESWTDLAQAAAPPGVAVHRIDALLAGRRSGPTPELRDRVDLDGVATIVFTSGTSGAPKGAMLTHDNHRASAHAWAGLLRPVPGHRWLACLPLFHVAGLAIVTRTMRWGAPLDLLHAFDPHVVSTAIGGGVTHLSLVPAQLASLLDARGDEPPPASLVAVLLGGGPIPVEVIARSRAAGFRVLTTYGMTETASGVASGGADPLTLADPRAGRALPGVQLRVAPDAPDGSGEVLVRGEMVFTGYVGDPEGSAARLRDGWLHTGDVGTLDEAGLLRILDRREDLIISGGENIAPAEVEAVLEAHPHVAEAAVVGRPDPRWGAVPVAFVVPAAGAQLDPLTLERHCREHLAGFKVPLSFEVVMVLPRNAFGKLQRGRLRDAGRSAYDD